MTNRIAKRKWFFLFAAAILASASVICAGVFSAKRQQPNERKQQKQVVELPQVISHVPKLVIVGISVKKPGTSDAVAVIEILNTSHLPVMCVEISTKNQAGDSGAFNEDGLDDPDKPQVVIPPYGTKTLEMPFTNMVPDAPLVLSAAFFLRTVLKRATSGRAMQSVPSGLTASRCAKPKKRDQGNEHKTKGCTSRQ